MNDAMVIDQYVLLEEVNVYYWMFLLKMLMVKGWYIYGKLSDLKHFIHK